MDTTSNSQPQIYSKLTQIGEAKSLTAKGISLLQKFTLPTWLRELGREVFVWGLIYAGTIGLFLVFKYLIS